MPFATLLPIITIEVSSGARAHVPLFHTKVFKVDKAVGTEVDGADVVGNEIGML